MVFCSKGTVRNNYSRWTFLMFYCSADPNKFEIFDSTSANEYANIVDFSTVHDFLIIYFYLIQNIVHGKPKQANWWYCFYNNSNDLSAFFHKFYINDESYKSCDFRYLNIMYS